VPRKKELKGLQKGTKFQWFPPMRGCCNGMVYYSVKRGTEISQAYTFKL
jgi:hypothetical protein